MDWFTVDRNGLSKLLERKGKAFAVLELWQNAVDTNAKNVSMMLVPLEGPFAQLTVTDDDPDGFKTLAHAWTLFAESEKKGDPEKRGRFNLGEKLVLALATEAEIVSTTGGVRFDKTGRHTLRQRRPAGSLFTARIRMTRDELEEALRICRTLIPPEGVLTELNGKVLPARVPLATVELPLLTEIADADGVLRRSVRKAKVEIHSIAEGESASLYEMGIPVVATGDKWHMNVLQKVPLNFERDGVPASYLRTLRAAVLNVMAPAGLLPLEEAKAGWVTDGLSSPMVKAEAVKATLDARFGPKRVAYDPSDLEANNRAVAEGYAVLHGGALPAEAWENVRSAGAAPPAGQVTPTPRPFSASGRPLAVVLPKDQTEDEMQLVFFARHFASFALGVETLSVTITRDRSWGFAACYNREECHLTIRTAPLPAGLTRDSLLIHELAHHLESNHLSERYHEACCELGAKMALMARELPELWSKMP